MTGIRLLILLLMFFPPDKNIVLKTFCEGWLASEPTYRFPLDQLTAGRPIYYYPRLKMGDKQKIWQMRKKHRLSGVPGDLYPDGCCNFKDFAVLAKWWRSS